MYEHPDRLFGMTHWREAVDFNTLIWIEFVLPRITEALLGFVGGVVSAAFVKKRRLR